jgi:transcriptional antiterminator RfaH
LPPACPRRLGTVASAARFGTADGLVFMENRQDWYLVRTKPGKERWVQDQLSTMLPEVFLPLLEAKTPRWGKLAWTRGPLFPGYLFARFDLQTRYFDIRYLPGVSGFVSAGNDPLVVPVAVIEEIRCRAVEGVIKLQEPVHGRGDKVQIVQGPFRGFDAIFERYLSGAERVAILLSTIEASGLRMVLPASAIARSS